MFPALVTVCACFAACDEGDAKRDAEVSGGSSDNAQPAQTRSDDAATIDNAVPTNAATPPAPPTTALSDGSSSGITITFVEFDCDGYRFEVESQPEALLRVHWTAAAPDDPDPSSSRSVSDNETSQSPGEHTFEQSKQAWAKPGSNRLTIRAENVAGGTHEESRAISC
jgi:hypothetical protein